MPEDAKPFGHIPRYDQEPWFPLTSFDLSEEDTRMTRRRVMTWLSVILVPGLLAAVPQVSAQTLVATARSAGRLADDLEYLVKSLAPAGDEGLQAALGTLRQFKEGELLKGLDQKRLLGVAATLPREPGGLPMIVGAVPVTDYAQFLDSLKNVGMTVDAQSGVPGFSHKITTPDGAQTVFALEARKYAFFSLIPSRADTISKLDPAAWRPQGGTQGDLSVVLNLAALPDALKDQFVNGLEASLGEKQAQRPGESNPEYKGRMAGTRITAEAVKSLIREGESVELAMNVDPSREEVVVDLTASARPGTALAKTLNDFKGRKSRFTWMGADAPFGVGEPAGSQRARRCLRGDPRDGSQGSGKQGQERCREGAQRSAFYLDQAGGDGGRP